MRTIHHIFRLRIFPLALFICILPALVQPQDSSNGLLLSSSKLPFLVPPETYVSCGPYEGGTEASPASITLAEAMELTVQFNREKLPSDCGVQFLSITISIYNQQGILLDKILKHALTFPVTGSPDSDLILLNDVARKIVPFGFVSSRKINSVLVLNDSVPDWSLIKIEVVPDDEYTKFAERLRYSKQWWYRVKGTQFEQEFFLGIPKVLYDTNSKDTMTYGNASAMIRLYYLHPETGKRFPMNIGIGTFGVSTPIDVSKSGGGFAVSLLFDVVQAARLMYNLNITSKVNAGIEITPFFPLQKQARLLLNARIGYSP